MRIGVNISTPVVIGPRKVVPPGIRVNARSMAMQLIQLGKEICAIRENSVMGDKSIRSHPGTRIRTKGAGIPSSSSCRMGPMARRAPPSIKKLDFPMIWASQSTCRVIKKTIPLKYLFINMSNGYPRACNTSQPKGNLVLNVALNNPSHPVISRVGRNGFLNPFHARQPSQSS